MVYRLKSLVSKKKKRFQADGFDLDLSYISPRIIAMGFPAERIEGLYRNHIDEVSRFFELRHKGHYKIYHLCNERDFNEYRFSGPVVRYPFSDHNAPQFEQILALCQDVMQFLNVHPENVVAINCKAGKGRTGVMVCACLMELQEARNAEEALRLYAEKRTCNGQGVTIPSQRRYVQYYSRLLSSALTYEPTPLRLTSIRIEGLPHQLHGVQNFELSISTYQNRLSMNNHNHDPTHLEDTSHLQSSAPTSPAVGEVAINAVTVDSNLTADYDFHRHSDVNTYQIPCSTHHSDSGSYLIRLDEPVTVFEDFRIKIKAKSGVLTKKIGQCWLNTFFILLDDGAPVGNCSSNAINASAKTIVPLAPTTSNVDCCSTSDSNSGSGSSSDSSASTASSTSSSVRNSPPHFAGVNEEDEDMYVEEEGLEAEVVHDHKSLVEGAIDEKDVDELLTLTSNSATLNPISPVPQDCTPTPQHTEMLRRSSNPLQFGPPSKIASSPGIGASGAASMPFISIPKKDSSTTTTNFTKKSSNANLMLAPSLSTQLATPLAVRVLELSQSDLDAAIKGKGKKGEEFKVLFEFIRETPCSSQSSSTCCGNCGSGVSSANPAVNSTTTTTTTSCCSNQTSVPMDLGGIGCGGNEDLPEMVVREERRIVENAAVSLSTPYLSPQHHHHHHHPHNHFHPPTESRTNQTGALVL
ncbi:hypothetical protein Aperf_G00000013181 [Anoplocephala perfoliata]